MKRLEIPGIFEPVLEVGLNEVNALSNEDWRTFQAGVDMGRFVITTGETSVLTEYTRTHNVTAEHLSRMSADEWKAAQEHIASGRYQLVDQIPQGPPPDIDSVVWGSQRLALLPDGSTQWVAPKAMPSDATDITPDRDNYGAIQQARHDPVAYVAGWNRRMQGRLERAEAEIAERKARLGL